MRRKLLVAVPIVLCCLYLTYVLVNKGPANPSCETEKARLEEMENECERKRHAPDPEPPNPSLLPVIGNLTRMNIIPPFQKYVSVVRNKFSVIIPTYKRMLLLVKVLNNYCSLPSHIDMIIVVWNDLETPIPESLTNFKCNATILVKKEKVNSLHNRFLPFPELRTEGR